MKNTIKLLLGTIILIIIIAGAYFTFGSGGFSITGAFTGTKECIKGNDILYFDACEEWRDNGWTDKPAEFRVLSENAARQLCDKLLADYRIC